MPRNSLNCGVVFLSPETASKTLNGVTPLIELMLLNDESIVRNKIINGHFDLRASSIVPAKAVAEGQLMLSSA